MAFVGQARRIRDAARMKVEPSCENRVCREPEAIVMGKVSKELVVEVVSDDVGEPRETWRAMLRRANF